MFNRKNLSWLGAAVLATVMMAACGSGQATEAPIPNDGDGSGMTTPTEVSTTESNGQAESPTEAAGGDTSALSGTSWTLTEIDGTAVDASIGATISFEPEGRVTGSGGCNGFGGEFVAEGDKITFGEIISTLMACDDSKMGVETPYLGSLQGTATFSLNGDALVITTASGVKLTFAKS